MKTPSVRKVISIMLSLLFCYMVYDGRVDSDQMVPLYTMVLGFYFGKSTALDTPKERNREHE